MGRTYIGYGYTNSEGVATLDYDANGNQLPKKSYACHSSRVSVVAEASIDNVITSSNSIRFCEGYVPPTDTLSLTADKPVLSYADNDSCTLTATFESANGVSGKSVVFKVGDTVLDTVMTGGNGVAEYEYESQGVGDVTFTVECMNLQETYELQDCMFCHLTEETVTRTSSDVLTQEVVQNTQLTLPQKFEMSFKLKSTINGYRAYLTPVSNKSANDPNYALFLQQYSNLMTCGYRTSSTNALINNRNIDGTVYHDWKVVRDGNSFKYYFDGVEVASTTISWFDDYAPHTIVFNCWSVGSVSLKELKIKPL